MQNCGYPFTELTGAGVALKLAQALIKEMIPLEEQEKCFGKYADLATLGTIADLGPLVGENRIIVKEAWNGWQKVTGMAAEPYLRCVELILKTQFHMNHIGFRLAPRIY